MEQCPPPHTHTEAICFWQVADPLSPLDTEDLVTRDDSSGPCCLIHSVVKVRGLPLCSSVSLWLDTGANNPSEVPHWMTVKGQ